MNDALRATEYKYYGETLTKFTMGEFEVDGIHYMNPMRAFDNFMVSYKEEIDEFGDPIDTGVPWNSRMDTEISEQHWLSCGVVVSVGRVCLACEKVAE